MTKKTYYPLTTPQQNIWNLQKYYPDTAIGNLCGAIFYQEELDDERLEGAINRLLFAQTGLRLRFAEKNGESKQYVQEYSYEKIPVRRFESREKFETYAFSAASTPIGLFDHAMYRFEIIHIGTCTGVFALLSHLISDAWSFRLIAEGIDRAYKNPAESYDCGNIDTVYDYTDFIRSEQKYLGSKRYKRDEEFWTEKYASEPAVTPVKTGAVSSAPITAGRHCRKLSLALTKAIRDFCRESDISQAVLFEAAMSIYLSKIHSEHKAVTLGIPVLNRSSAREKDTVGMFISTMPFTVEVSLDDTVLQLMRRIMAAHYVLFRHQKYPYANILEIVRSKQHFSGQLYDVMVSFQNAQIDGEAFFTEWFSNGYSEVPFVLHIDDRDRTDSYRITIDYQTEIFRQEKEICLIMDRLEYIIAQMIADSRVSVKNIDVIPESERQKILLDFNDTAADYPKEKCVHELFAEQVRKTPEKYALVFEEKKFTYRQLEEMSNSLAYFLRERGVRPNDVIPIISIRSWHVIVAMLGVLKAGGAYMPVDPGYPEDRIRNMIKIANAKCVLQYGYEKKLETETFDLETIDYTCHTSVIENVNRPEDLCYVIFTSGSTGEPKGIAISHYNIINYLFDSVYNLWCHEMIGGSFQRVVSVTNIIFDIFATESILPLLNGMTIFFANESEAFQQGELNHLICSNQIEILQTTPTKMRSYLNDENYLQYLRVLKYIVLIGEAFQPDLYEEMKKYTNAGIYNNYGPAETTVWSTNKEVLNADNITIGKPIANTQIYILDCSQSLLPVGVPGELCIAGAGVGKGYLNRPELTAERFIKNPFATEENGHGKILYRTGDLARWREDGEVEYLGRIDTQVKIRGLRIELGEIEHVMNDFPGIQMAVVAEKRDENNRQYLAGYYTADREVSVKELRRHLASKLPGYMVPNYFVYLDAIPMTPSGKTDRKNLPLPDFTVPDSEYAEPETKTEQRLAEIWQEKLRIERVGKTDNFLELGGDSLSAIAVLSQVETLFQVDISVRDIMGCPSLEQLARLIDQAELKEDRIAVCDKKRYRLLPQQKAIYADCRKKQGVLTYHIPAVVKLPDDIDREKLKQCILETVNRHQALKTRIVAEGDEIYGVYDETAEIRIEEYNGKDAGNFVKPFSLDKAPLVRIGLTEDALLFDIHHIIADGRSLDIILRDIAAAYQSCEPEGNEYQYSDYAEYFWQKDFAEHRDYFREMLKCDFEPVILPERFKMSEAENVSEGEGQSVIYDLPEYAGKQAKQFARIKGLTDTMVFLGAYGILLAKYTGQADIFSSVIFSNRTHQEMQNVVGMFVNTLPVVIAAEGSTAAYYERIKQLVLGLHQYQELPFTEIADTVGIRDKSVLNTAFIYQGDGEKRLLLNGQRLAAEFVDTHTAKFDFCMEVTPSEKSYRIRIEYNRAKYDDALIHHLYEAYVRIFSQLGRESIADISVLSEEEHHKLLTEFNDTAVSYPGDKCVHELFTEQARKTPEKLALVFEDKKFTYRQVDEMSNSLAHLLREKGVRPNDVVPIIAKRSWHVIVAMLGVLKAGGAYMPVDPAYPAERIQEMIGIANAACVLQYGYDKKLMAETFNLDEIDYAYDMSVVENVNRPEDSCYVIFTSGSTGEPKGISLRHQSVANYACNSYRNIVCHELVKEGCQRMVSVTNIIFDIFVTESILPLLKGLTVYFANDREMFQQNSLNRLICENQIEVMQTTPTKMRSYLGESGNLEYLHSLKCIILGGEALPSDLYEKIRGYTSAKIFNIYGPAETTVWSTNKEVTDTNDITVGKPIANTQIYILDRSQSLLPIGVPGELCIAGAGVGKGYLNRPELIAERFIKNPFATEENGHGKILYRTGDLARWREDGEIEYLGRIDTQVKIRGLRIELGEIEHAMNDFPGIRMAVVAEKRDENNRQYLAGYYTADREVSVKELRRHLASKLPRYMVPNYFVHLDEIPMTPSGKTDRKNLPLPDFAAEGLEYAAPETKTEQRLAEIWKKSLRIDQVGKTDNFLESGGDSLSAIEILNQVESQFQVEISVKDIMECLSLERLAQLIDRTEQRADKMIAHGRSRYQLLPQQKAIYADCCKKQDTLAYNIPAVVKLPKNIDREKLKQCIFEVANRHQELKTYILVDKEEIYGIYDETAKIIVEEYDEKNVEDFVKPFCLDRAPLVRIGITKDRLLFDIHHIIADGRSLDIILQDIAAAYQDDVPERNPYHYSDYAEYFRQKDFTEHKDYFRNMLKCDFEPVILPECFKTSKAGMAFEKNGQSVIYDLPEYAGKQAKQFARIKGLTDTMVFLGAYGILLAKYTGQADIFSSVIFSNRTHQEMQNVVGMFVNTLPVAIAAEGSTAAYYERIKQLVLGLHQYQELPFMEIADAVGIRDKSVLNTAFIYQGDGEKRLLLNGQKLAAEFVDTHTAKFDFCMEVTPSEKSYQIRIEYNRAKYDDSLINHLYEAYVRIFSQLGRESIADISVLSEEEHHKLLTEFNDTAVPYPRDKCVHELFTEQARKTPEKLALVFEDKKFTYRQLDEMSNSLAHLLRERGVRPNDVVPIIAKRSWHVIVAMFGVLKAGGAYMLIGSDYPKNRINYMVTETGAKYALVYKYFEKVENVYSIDLSIINWEKNIEPIKNCNSSDDSCYVLFTSGTTGKPKAVVISHYNLNNFVNKNEKNVYQNKLLCKCRCVLAVTTLMFDIFVFETQLPLLNGLKVVLTSNVSNAREIAKLIVENDVDAIHITPTKLLMLLQTEKFQTALEKIKALMSGAEVFTQELYKELLKYTNAYIYNGYGPTETTIGNCFKHITSVSDITIGRPIANTQIYILDHSQSLLPIGVPGELCIAGAGVGKGYLNRPELTAERFIKNPFATEENGHGKILYRTGDLARWREDGEIEYLGRIDTQVKIRGLRIELGEIEHVMNDFPGIRMAVVAEKRDENNRQYLAGYYTADREVSVKELRRHLASKLPRYMVPNYFVHLDEIPMTPSGKTDRKNLPLPDFAVQGSEYVAPETEKEKTLCGVLADIFHLEAVGVEDDFFEIGGDSLKAIEYIAKAQDAEINIALQNVFDYPTVRQMSEFLENGTNMRIFYEAEEFVKYRPFLERNVIDQTFVPHKKGLGNVLLTGATGFLGAHILDALMREMTETVYCLVRGNGREDGSRRLENVLDYYFGGRYTPELGKRIVAVPGDIEQEGLSSELPGNIRTIIHGAASVKHYGSYEYFERVNAQGTRHVVDCAKRAGAKLIHISTLSVSGNSMAEEFSGYRSEEEKQFYETSFYIGQPLDNVYIHSKFKAEKAVYDAMLDGLDAKVIRVGNLTNRASDYKFQPNYRQNAFLTRVKAALEFGLFPDYLMPLYSEFSPVDLTAEGIVKIAQYAGEQCVFHLNSNRPLYYERMMEILDTLHIPMKVVPGDVFYRELRRTLKHAGTEYIYEAFQNDMDGQGRLVYDSNIRIRNEFTMWFMGLVGFAWNETDETYLRGYIEYFRRLGYLEV